MPQPLPLKEVTQTGKALARSARTEKIVMILVEKAVEEYLSQIIALAVEDRFALSPISAQELWRDALQDHILSSDVLSAEVQTLVLEDLLDAPLPGEAYTSAMIVVGAAAEQAWSRETTLEVMAWILSPETGYAVAGSPVENTADLLFDALTAAGQAQRKRAGRAKQKRAKRAMNRRREARNEEERRVQALADRAGLAAAGMGWLAKIQRDARMALTRANSIMTMTALDFYGIPNKRWITRRDERVRDTHVAADGQTVGVNDWFSVGQGKLTYPGDPLGPYAEIVNCRCFMVGVDAEGKQVDDPEKTGWESLERRNRESQRGDLSEWYDSPVG